MLHVSPAILVAKDVMTEKVISVAAGSTVGEVADLMVKTGISAAPVMAGDKLVGMVSAGDLMRRAEIGTQEHRRSWWLRLWTEGATLAAEYTKSHSIHVTDVMSTNVITVNETTPIRDIAHLLEAYRIKRLPVMRNGRLVGIVSRSDLVRALASVEHAPMAPVAQRDDASIKRDVLKALEGEKWASVENCTVSVVAGVVHFTGLYSSKEEQRASHVLAENVPGVKGIVDSRAMLDVSYNMM